MRIVEMSYGSYETYAMLFWNFDRETPLARLLPSAARSPLGLSVHAINFCQPYGGQVVRVFWVCHLFRAYIRWQTRGLALSNDLTQSQPRRIGH
jgi:hypothetical protein